VVRLTPWPIYSPPCFPGKGRRFLLIGGLVDPEPAWTLCKRDSCIASAENRTTHRAAPYLSHCLNRLWFI